MILGARLVETKRNCCFVRCGVRKALWKRVFKETASAKLMPFVLLVSLAVLLSNGALSAFAATPVSPSVTYDPAAERKLLDLANQARIQAGLTPLRTDEGLTEAAREHAAAIAERQQLSHQLPGERPLAQRLTASTNLHLERGGENVATAATVDQIYASLMRSAPHRENLLNHRLMWPGLVLCEMATCFSSRKTLGREEPHTQRRLSRTWLQPAWPRCANRSVFRACSG